MRNPAAVIALVAVFTLASLGIGFTLDPSATVTVIAHAKRRNSRRAVSHATQALPDEPELLAIGLKPRGVPIKIARTLLGYKARSEVYELVRKGILEALK